MSDRPPKPTPNFALDDLVGTLEELTEEEEDSQGFFTTTEIRRKRGWGREKIRNLLRKAQEEGRLILGRKRIQFLDGRMVTIVAYKIKPKEEEKDE